jgi:hypothetical protein
MDQPTPFAKFLAERLSLFGIEFQYWQILVIAVFAIIIVLAWTKRI